MTIKGSNNDCSFSATPESVDIALDFEEGKAINVVEEMKKVLTLTPEGSTECPVNELVRYKTSAGLVTTNNYRFDATEGARSSVFTITDKIK